MANLPKKILTEIEAANAILQQTVHQGSGVVSYQPMAIDPWFGTSTDGKSLSAGYGAAGELGFQMAVHEKWLRVCTKMYIITMQGRNQLIKTGIAPIKGGGTLEHQGRENALTLLQWTDNVGGQFNLLEMAFPYITVQSVVGSPDIPEPKDIDIALAIEFAGDQGWLKYNAQRYLLTDKGREAARDSHA